MSIIMYAIAVLVISRVAFLVLLRRFAPSPRRGSAAPSVSVVVPAYNESVTAVATVRNILSCGYPVAVLFVDDGSTDGTADLVRSEFARDARVKVLVKSNGGKAAAINTAIGVSTSEIIITVDADTVLTPGSVERIVSWFEDPAIAAVAGHVEVGNRDSVVAALQHDEYVSAQSFERDALSRANGIMVVPGAFGAFRQSVVRKLGGYATDTLAEDCELTVRLVKAGYKVVYDRHAVAVTEAPDNMTAYIRQRFRWGYGTAQVLWKYRSLMFSRRFMGIVTMPYALVAGYLLPTIYPIIDFMLIFSIFTGNFIPPVVLILSSLLSYTVYMLMSGFGLADLHGIFARRALFRYVNTMVSLLVFRSILSGELVGWNKNRRTGILNDRRLPDDKNR